ncbi:hypothetical protein CRENBAI_013230 [Crenichthys baileyi]|uniref:Uncharacterized protein n=1 Tax=Crenichthys baileyi TaxID=28760 RepID=A0AAV9RZ56_9TELE
MQVRFVIFKVMTFLRPGSNSALKENTGATRWLVIREWLLPRSPEVKAPHAVMNCSYILLVMEGVNKDFVWVEDEWRVEKSATAVGEAELIQSPLDLWWTGL